MKFTKVLVVLLAVLTIFGCRKDIDGVPTEVTIVQDPVYLQVNNFFGLVVDENGAAISDAIVDFTNISLTTDENGYFRFTEIPINENGFLFTVKKNGYFQGYKFVFPNESNETFMKIMMVKKDDAQVFNSLDGGTIQISQSDATVSFTPNSIVTESTNAPYEGEVQIYSHWYNPDLPSTSLSMPGDLRGVDKDSKLVALASFGMVAVELYGSNGEKLNLASGKTATIRMQAPNVEELPGVMPMWFFDETRGNWIEEGSATLTDGMYTAEVSHFSFWNCDDPYDLVQITGTVVTNDGRPVYGAHVVITILNSGLSGSGFTNSDGEYSGKVPKDTPLSIMVYDDCGDLVYDSVLGTFSEDSTAPPVFADIQNAYMDLSGRVVCSGVPLANGYVVISTDNEEEIVVQLDAEGNFNLVKITCDNDISAATLVAYSTEQPTNSEEVTLDSLGIGFIYVGDVEACELQQDEWISLVADQEDYGYFYDVYASYDLNGLVFGAETQSQLDISTEFRFFNAQLGDNQADQILINSGTNFMFCQAGDCSTMNVNTTTLDEFVDGYVIGTYSGIIEDSEDGPIEVSGDFRIKIDNYQSTAAISGEVWVDENVNGLIDDGEDFENFQSLRFLQDDNSYPITINNDGTFKAHVLSDLEFYLEFVVPVGYGFTLQNVGSDDSIDNDFNSDGFTDNYTLSQGELLENIGLGVVTAQTLSCSPATQNGIFESCDFSTQLLEVAVTDGTPPYMYEWNTGETSETITVSNAGTYIVTVSDVNGVQCETTFWYSIIEAYPLQVDLVQASCNEANGSITVINADEYSSIFWTSLGLNEFYIDNLAPGIYTYDAYDNFGCNIQGEYEIVNTGSVIGNQVWLDRPGGMPNTFDTGDAPLDSVMVILYDATTQLIVAQQMTDINGNYLFMGDYFGEFYMEFIPPSGYQYIESIGDVYEELNSDADPETGLTDTFIIECGDVFLDVDAGFIE